MRIGLTGAICLLGFMASASAQLATAYDDDGMVTVNGNRTFFIGTYHAGHKGGTVAQEHYDELRDAGFNLVQAGSAAARDMAHAAELMTWAPAGTIKLDDRKASARKLREAVAKAKDHPSLAFLETVDEPAWVWKKAEARVPAEALVEAYPIIKSVAPDKLIYTNHAPTNLVSTMQAYNDGTDIVAMDIYPVNPGNLAPTYSLFEDGHQGDLNNMTISQVGEYVDKMRRVTGPNRPLFMVLQGFAWEMLRDEAERDESKVLYPTYDEQRFMAFQSIIKGANGIVYWGSWYTPQPSAPWADLKRAVREVADLAGVLAARATAPELTITYHEIGHSVDDGIQWTAREQDGALYVLTCNAYRYPCKATIAGFGDWAKAEVLYEDREVELKDGALTETWPPFDVNVYKLSR